MKIFAIVLASAATLALVGAAHAADPAAQPAAQPTGNGGTASAADTAKPAAPQPPKICRSIDTTGSHLGGKRVCLTREEWSHYDDEQGDENARDQRYLDSHSTQLGPPK